MTGADLGNSCAADLRKCAVALTGLSRYPLPPCAEPVLAIVDLLLSTLGLAGASAAPPPPFALDALGSAPSGGSAMEDWLLAVVAGGDGAREGEQEAAAAEADAGGDADLEYEEELLVPGGQGGWPGWG